MKKTIQFNAIEILKQERDHCQFITNDKSIIQKYDEAIKEIEDLANENKSLVKTLEKMDKEMNELRKVNQDLLNTVIEAQKVIKNVLEAKKWKNQY